jgi:DNA ligase-1
MVRFQPMLGSPVRPAQLAELKYPVLVSPKYDGIRALVLPGSRLVSRKLKPIENLELRELFGRRALVGCDGELVHGNPAAPDCYHRTQQVVNTRHASIAAMRYWVFDTHLRFSDPFTERHARIPHGEPWVRVVPQFRCRTPSEVLAREQWYAERGWEGVMIRAASGYYKFGRSSVAEGLLLKLKRSQDSEAVVLYVYERRRNTNRLERDARGYAKRSNHQAGKVPTGLLGGFHCRDLKSNVEFDCGTGVLKHDELTLKGWKGVIIKYRFQPVGVKDKPRYPRYVGRRTRSDL